MVATSVMRGARRMAQGSSVSRLAARSFSAEFLARHPAFAAHFHVVAFADDDRMKAFTHEPRHRAMRRVHERTGRLDHVQATVARFSHRAFRGSVRRHHHRWGAHIGGLLRQADALRVQIGKDGFVVDEVAKNGERL